MNTRALVAGFALLLIPIVSVAQTEETPDIAKLLKDVRSVAEGLQDNISGLEAALQASINSREEGTLVLDRMQSSVGAVHAQLDEKSEIWTALVKAMETWEKKRQEMLEKSATNTAFKPIAAEWATRIEKTGVLRAQILTQRAESMALLDQIATDRDVVLAYFELGQADRALEAMQKVSEDLGRMNESMRTIVEQTVEVAGPSVPQ